MQALIEIKQVYGREMIYPANDTAKAFADLAKTKTLSRQDLNIIKSLGFAIEVKQQSINI